MLSNESVYIDNIRGTVWYLGVCESISNKSLHLPAEPHLAQRIFAPLRKWSNVINNGIRLVVPSSTNLCVADFDTLQMAFRLLTPQSCQHH